jgi:hypothetical protein
MFAGAFGDEFISKLGGALPGADESQMWLELLRGEFDVALADTSPLEKKRMNSLGQ